MEEDLRNVTRELYFAKNTTDSFILKCAYFVNIINYYRCHYQSPTFIHILEMQLGFEALVAIRIGRGPPEYTNTHKLIIL